MQKCSICGKESEDLTGWVLKNRAYTCKEHALQVLERLPGTPKPNLNAIPVRPREPIKVCIVFVMEYDSHYIKEVFDSEEKANKYMEQYPQQQFNTEVWVVK